ncbi:MAG: hypothetical protein ACRDH2_01740 [Anaerolineales bacterium]
MITDRSAVLNQLASGQLSAEEAARLLREPTPAPAESKSSAATSNRWLRIRITNLETGRPKVNVNLPLAWVKWGLQIGAKHSPEIAGLDFNEIVEQIQAGAQGKLIEVEDTEDGERVEIYVE